VQWLTAEAVEIQVQVLALPIGGRSLDDEAAMGQEKIQQVRQLCRRDLLGQLMSQRAGQVQHPSFGIQLHLQADAEYAQGRRNFLVRGRVSIEQTPEEFISGTQNCRLELAVSVVGKLGTGPIPGRFRNGSTAFNFCEG
jgi:hypothetical protein